MFDCSIAAEGDILPNGAKVRAVQQCKRTGNWFVLAEMESEGENSYFQPFVTWQSSKSGQTFWGHYFQTFADACADFHDRVAGRIGGHV